MLPGITPIVAGIRRAADPNNVLLLHFDGADGGTNFLDSSPNPKTVTQVGAAKISTDQSVFGGASAYFGAVDRINIAAHSSFAFGNSAYTIDFWVRTSKTAQIAIVGQESPASSTGFYALYGNNSSSGQLTWFENNTARITANATGFNNGNWRHIAITRTANTVRLFLDGVQIGTYTTSFSFGGSTLPISAGGTGQAATLTGYMDELRISNVSRWSANFTPPTSPYF